MSAFLEWCRKHVPRPVISFGNPSGNPNGLGFFVGIKFDW